MTQRIAVFGTESTGKTTLARQLATHFNATWAPEYVRAFWDANAGHIEASDLATIARGQIANEDAAAARANALVICDTELLTNTLWADVLFPGQCPAWVRSEAKRRSRTYTLYLLCDADIPFADDKQRCFPQPEERERYRRLWQDTLTQRKLPFVVVRGTYRERLATAIAAIERTIGCTPA